MQECLRSAWDLKGSPTLLNMSDPFQSLFYPIKTIRKFCKLSADIYMFA